jgi:hypothetical protein
MGKKEHMKKKKLIIFKNKIWRGIDLVNSNFVYPN